MELVAMAMAVGGFAAVAAWGACEVRASAVVVAVSDLVTRMSEAADGIRERLRAVSGVAEPSRVTLGEASEMVDIVRLGLSAGLSFDAALGLYCEQCTGLLPESMMRARMSWQTGMASREEGLMAAARELGVRQLESFAAAVAQAHTLGAPLSDTLARQGREMRAAHRAAVEREIERAPVKMLVPTGTLILPALLLSIVGPLLAAGGMV